MTEDVPEWDLGDRLRKSLRQSGIGVQEMASYLEVGRSTVSSWINGRNRPSAPTLKLWALRTGVPYEWLRDGDLEVRAGGQLRKQLPARPLELAA